jgi:hypothetical protein
MTSPKSKRRVWVVEMLVVEEEAWEPWTLEFYEQSAIGQKEHLERLLPNDKFRIRPYQPEEE